MSAPLVPERPSRSQPKASADAANPSPQVPPRPQRAGMNGKSNSPERDAFARSPLNDSPFAAQVPPPKNGDFYKQGRSISTSSLPNRPPSVSSLPMIGQEGIEYASLENTGGAAEGNAPEAIIHRAASPNHTRNVAGDLPLHAPRASLPAQAAAEQVAPLTRTDSRTAASAGIGQAQTEYDEHHHHSHHHSHGSRSGHHQRPPSAGFQRPPSGAHSHRPASSRAESIHGDEEEHGIPVIGLQVPMYPNAGDVQAPSPGQIHAHHPPGIGFFNDGRRKSAQGSHNPPGSYGLHGHGVIHQDQFEKSWYQKHPEELAKEEYGAYGPSIAGGRSEWALSSEQLNDLVRASSAQDTSTKGTIPSELIGHVAAEAYASRLASEDHSPIPPPALANLTPAEKHAVSPLRQTISSSPATGSGQHGNGTIHIDDAPQYHTEYGHETHDDRGNPMIDQSEEDHSPTIDRRNTRTPILASDEVAKHRYGESLHAAVSAENLAHDESYYGLAYRAAGSHRPGSGGSRSRPNSRPNSVHNLSRFSIHEDGTHTPLEEIEEYEPLFTDNDPRDQKTEARKFKRPDNLEKHRFPSLDIWEDTPTSLQLETTVEGPQEPLEKEQSEATKAATFESPEAEAARKGETTEAQRVQGVAQRQASQRQSSMLELEQEAKARPAMQQRFPSLDVWEDTPDSLSLTTTVAPMSPEGPTATVASVDALSKSPPGSKPTVPARPAQRVARPVELPAPATKSNNETSPVEKKQPPLLPSKPKPQVPARPSRIAGHTDTAPADGSPLAKSMSAGSASGNDDSATATKPKPAVPARPGATGKVAQMRAGFMNDLNSRLQLGPQATRAQPTSEVIEQKEEEKEEEEKVPLADARKGRARGPTRRKPASSPEKDESTAPAPAKPAFSFWTPQSVWQIGSDGGDSVNVFDYSQAEASKSSGGAVAADLGEQPHASPLATNTAGDRLMSKGEAPKTASGALAHSSNADMDRRAAKEEAMQEEEVREHLKDQIGSKHDMPEPDSSSSAVATSPAGENVAVSPTKSVQAQPMETVLTDDHPETEFAKSQEGLTKFEPLEKQPTATEEDGGVDLEDS